MPRLPLRITPHALLETLVEVHYAPRTYSEVALGAFFYALQPAFAYERPPALPEGIPLALLPGAEPTFRTEDLILRIRPTSFNFSAAGDYPGWERYFGRIKDVLTRLYATGEVTAFPRVGVRYVNALPWGPLNQQLRLAFPQMGELPTPDATVFQASFSAGEFRIILNLGDNQQLPGREGRHSLFDIDVILDGLTITNLPTLFAQIERVHTREKEVFFGLLSDEFLLTLQPEYAPES